MIRTGIVFFCWIVVPFCAPRPVTRIPSPIVSIEQMPENDSTQPANVLNSAAQPDTLLENILRQYPDYFNNILANRDSLHIQIMYSQIDRDTANKPIFTDYYFNVDSNNYFYPASTVKLPVALLALQRLNELRLPGLNRNSTMITESAYSGQTPVYNDPTTPDGRPSVSQYIRKIFLVSDNDAFNRLYEFLGPQYINEQLRKKGYRYVEIVHRLSLPMTADENRHTNPIRFFDSANKLLYEQPAQVSQLAPLQRTDIMGRGYVSNGQLVNRPFDFSRKNRISLPDLHHILRSVLFPESVPENQRFGLKPEDYAFVLQYMSQYPPETKYPPYDSATHWDAYCKLLYWGSEKGPLPLQMRIFNKEGDAYGFLIDVACFTDFEHKIEFMLSATIYCNSDGIFNDDKYDYDSVGLPFMKNLGRVIYERERGRVRPRLPDLSSFKFIYDKRK